MNCLSTHTRVLLRFWLDMDLWAYANGVTLDFSRPGKPTDNGFIEAFNSKFRTECLNAHWFMTLADAREKLEDWRRDLYEQVRVNPPCQIFWISLGSS